MGCMALLNAACRQICITTEPSHILDLDRVSEGQPEKRKDGRLRSGHLNLTSEWPLQAAS